MTKSTISASAYTRAHGGTQKSRLRSDLSLLGASRTKTERDLVQEFLSDRESFGRGLPCDDADRVVVEMSFRYGRADIVIFHADGTASVIEAKDGAKGYSHVVAGIGQAGLYAAQLAMGGTLKAVRRCLLWSSTGDHRIDAAISVACDQAGVVWLPFPSLRAVAGLDALYSEAP